MVTHYYYTISADFPTYFNQSQLTSEVLSSSITTVFLAILVDSDSVDIVFDSALTVLEIATLNSVVASHAPITGGPPIEQVVPPIEPNATTPPTVTNDSDVGFEVGSIWIDTVTDTAYICTDATPGAAIWKPLTSSMANVGAGTGEIYKTTTATGEFDLKTVAAGDGIGITNNTNDISVAMDVPSMTPTTLLDLDSDYLPIYSVGASGHRKIHPVDFLGSVPKSNSTTSAPTVNDDSSAGYSNGSIWVNTTTNIAYVLVDNTDGAAVWKEASVQLTSSAPTNITKSAAVVGTSLFSARADHKHDISTAAPSTIGTANSEGTTSSLARADHVHNHGSQTDPTHHALATTSSHGFLSATDKTKIDFFNNITNKLSVQTNPGAGEFSSINAALATITTNSMSNPYLIVVGPGVFTETPISMKQFVYIRGSGDQVTNIVCSVPTGKCITGIDNSGIWDCNISGCTGVGGIGVYHTGVGTLAPFLVENCVFGSNETLVKAYGSSAFTMLQINSIRFGGASDNFTNGFICENVPGVPTGLAINDISYLDIVPPTGTVFSRTSGDMTSTVFTNSTIRIVPTPGTTAFYVEDGGDIRMSSSYIRGFDIGLHSANVGMASSITAQAVVFVETGTWQILIEHLGTTGHFFGSYLYPQISIPDAAPFYIDRHDHNNIIVAKKGGDFDSIAAAVDSIIDAGPTNVYTVDVHAGVFTEPYINMESKPYINIKGTTISGTTIIPDGNHDVMGITVFNEISFLTIKDVPAGYAGIVLNDGGDFGQCHKVSFYDADIGIKVVSNTQITRFYGEYVDFNGDYTYGVYVEANNGFEAFVNLENCYNFPMGATNPTGVYVTGPEASVIMLATGFYGESVGDAIYIQDGGSISTVATEIINWNKGLEVGNVGATPTVKINAVFSENITNDVDIQHPTTTGNISGTMERSKFNSASSMVSHTYNDPVDVSLVSVGKLFLGRNPTVLVDNLDLIQEGPCMGVYDGGVLSDGGGLVLDVSAGSGYYDKVTHLDHKDWSATSITLPANSSVYVYFNSSGTLTSNVTIPDTRYTILLGKVVTDATSICYIQRIPMTAHHYTNLVDRMLREAIGPLYVTGSIVTESGTRNLDVSSGEYYYSEAEFKPSGGTAITWDSYYRSAVPGVYTRVVGDTTVDNAFYDDGTGTLAAIPAGNFAKHLLYIVGDGDVEKYLMVYSQNYYTSQLLAEGGTLPLPPSFVNDSFARLSGIVVQEGNAAIVSFTDERPRPSYASSAVSGGITVHGGLSGLGADDHLQYIRVDGARAFTGPQSLGGNNLTSVGTVNGVTVETHGSRHLPNGADPLTTAAPATSLSATTTNAEGNANSFARSNHTHAISTAAASTQTPNQTNAAGTSASLARADHIHNIPTAAAVSISTSNGAGSAATFAASDHTHQGIHSLAANAGTARYGDINFANGTNVTITDNGLGTFTIAATGEANTASNVGSGADIFKQKTGVDLEFRGINAVSLLSATVNADNVDIAVNSSTLGNQILLSSGVIATEPTWGALPLGDTNAVTGTLAVVNGGTGVSTLTSGNVLVGAGTSAVTTTKAAPSGDFVGTTDTQTLGNKSMIDSTTVFIDDLDNTKKMQFQVSGVSTGTTRTLTVPNNSGTIALTGSNLGDFAATTSAQLAGIITDETGTNSLVFSNSPTLVTPSISSIVNIGTLTLPTSTDTLVGLSTTDTLNNKLLVDTTTHIANVSDLTKRIKFAVSGVSTGTTRTLTAQNIDGTIALTQNNLGVFATTTSSQLAGVISDETGTGSLVFSNGPTLVTPTLGAATATSINKVTITTPATGSTLTIADGKTLVVSNSLTFTGTDSSSVNFGSGGTVSYTGGTLAQFAATTSAQLAGVISDETGTGSLVFATSPTLITPSISSIVNGGTLTLPTSTDTLVGLSTTNTLTNKTVLDNTFVVADDLDPTKKLQFQVAGVTTGTTRTLTVPNNSGTIALTNSGLSQFSASTSADLAGIISDETGTGSLVFGTSPTLTTPSFTSVVNGGVTITLPSTTDTLVGLSTVNTLTNKTLLDGSTTIANTAVPTKKFTFDASGITAATTRTLAIQDISGTIALLQNNLGSFGSTTSAQLASVISDETGTGSLVFSNSPNLVTPSISNIINGGTLSLPTSSDTLVGKNTADSLTNKSLIDTTVFYDDSVTTKRMQFQLSDITAATTRTLTVPDASGTLVLTDNAQTLSNKVMTSSLNNVTASGLFTGGGSGTVSVVAATAPTAGQALVATSGTAATWQTIGGGSVTSVTGTTNRITITGTPTVAPVVDIAATYVGQTSITTLGTITTGVWTGTAVAAANGGTGLTGYTVGDLIYASGTTTLSKLADVATGNALISGGVGVAPSWGKIGLTTHVSGVLPVANGGTGSSSAFTQNSVIFAGVGGVLSENNTAFNYINSTPRLNIVGSAGTNQLRIGDQATDPDPGMDTCAVYMEQTTTGTPDGMRTYFRGATASSSGYITYSYDGNTPYIRLLDIDDDPSYVTFQTARIGLSNPGTFAAPSFVNSFGSRGGTATGTRGFSWRTNGGTSGIVDYQSLTEIMLLDDTCLRIPSRSTANRPAGVAPAPAATNGMIGYNSTLQAFEAYENGAWTLTSGLMAGNTIYSTGTASQSTTTITGVGTTFTQAMVGGVMFFANGVRAFITGFTSATVLVAAQSQTVSSQAYSLYHSGAQNDSSGNVSFSQNCFLRDNNTYILDATDSSRRFTTSIAGTTGTTTTLNMAPTANRTLTLPDITDTLVSKSSTDTLTNKTMTGATNTLTASLLKSATTEVSVSAATAPTTGQVLTATSSTTATWQTPTGSSSLTVVSLSSDATANNTTTLTEITGLNTTVGSGTYTFKYCIRYQSSATGTGVRFGVDHTGTTTSFLGIHRYTSTATGSATAAASMAASAANGNMYEAQGTRTKNVIIGATTNSVDTANADMLSIVEGMMIVTASGTLKLLHASENATSTQVMAGTSLVLTKVG